MPEKSYIVVDAGGWFYGGSLPGKRGPVPQWFPERASALRMDKASAINFINSRLDEDDCGYYASMRVEEF